MAQVWGNKVCYPCVLVHESSSLRNGLERAAFPIWHSYLHFLSTETGGWEVENGKEGGRERRSEEKKGWERPLSHILFQVGAGTWLEHSLLRGSHCSCSWSKDSWAAINTRQLLYVYLSWPSPLPLLCWTVKFNEVWPTNEYQNTWTKLDVH